MELKTRLYSSNIRRNIKTNIRNIIYQEQVMQIAQTLSWFYSRRSRYFKKSNGKKKKAELDKQKERFINGAIKKRY